MFETANAALIRIAGQNCPAWTRFNERDYMPASISQWIDHTHMEIRADYTITGRKRVFEHMSKVIITEIGWSPLAVSCITLVWAYYYGASLYADVNKQFPVFMDKFVEACMSEPGELSTVLAKEW